MSVLFLAFASSEVVRDMCAEIIMKHPGQCWVQGWICYTKRPQYFLSFWGGREGLSIFT